MVDAGVTSIDRAQKLFENNVSKLIIGTETLQSKKFVTQAVEIFGSNRVVVSLDLKGDKILVKLGFDGCLSPICLLKDFKAMGVSQVIVLDLARVGSGEGVNLDFLKKVIADVGVDVYVGGGVRDINDLVELRNLGVSGALIATALHTGQNNHCTTKPRRLSLIEFLLNTQFRPAALVVCLRLIQHSITRVLTPFFAAICINRFTRFFWRVPLTDNHSLA